MKNIISSRKGATLAELIVVLAVVSIISLIVVSFTVTVSNKAKNGRSLAAALSEVQMVEAVIEGWIDKNIEKLDIAEKSTVDLDTDNNIEQNIITQLKTTEFRLEFKNQCVIEVNSEDESEKLLCYTETITGLEFEILVNESNSKDIIIYCTIKYEIVLTNEEIQERTYTFTVNPRVGDSIVK